MVDKPEGLKVQILMHTGYLKGGKQKSIEFEFKGMENGKELEHTGGQI